MGSGSLFSAEPHSESSSLHAVRAHARLVAVRDPHGSTRWTCLQNDPPLTFRNTPQGLMCVSTAAGPLGGDSLCVEATIGPGAYASIGSTGATLVLPGQWGEPSSYLLALDVGPGATLRWAPEPTVIAKGAQHRMATRLTLADNCNVVLVDEMVLGRHGEQPGTCAQRIDVVRGDRPILRNGFVVGAPGWNGPAGIGTARGVAQVLLIGAPAQHWLSSHGGATAIGGHAEDCRWSASTLVDGSILLTGISPGIEPLRNWVKWVTGPANEARNCAAWV